MLSNITEIRLPSINLTISKTEEKENNKGILKITTDMNNLLSDNVTSDGTTTVEQYDSKLKNTIDDSTQELMGLLNPNLTTSQIEGLLHFLNNSINLNNIEAIIQNTQAEQKTVDKSTMDKESLLNNDGNFTDILSSTEVEYLNNTDDENNIENTTKTESITSETTTEKLINKTLLNITEIEIPPIAESIMNQPVNPILNQIQLLSLIIKIQKGLNTTAIINSYDPKTPSSIQINYLKTLCFGKKDITDLSLKILNLNKSERLLKIKATIKASNIYEKIENLCNLLADKLQLMDDIKK